MTKDFVAQLSLAGPLAVNLVTANAVACTNLYFVARGGTQQLAAAALGNNVAVMLGRLVLLGLCGALDTLAAQAWGAGKERRLPLLLQRTVLFLWLHCLGLSAAMLMLPAGLRALGQDPGLGAMVRIYLIALLPSVWLEALSRPITRVLVARGTVAPQMVISLVGLPLNLATNYVLVVGVGWEYVGAAAAMSMAAGYDVILLLLYVAVSGQWSDVIGRPSRRAFKGWRQLARLAYPAASMKCAESWAFTICTLAASLLPDACTATAAVGVSYNVYGVLFIAFVACSTIACVTTGRRLGAGDPRGAKLAAAGSLLIVPPAWGMAALVLLLPASQNILLSLFVAPSPGGSPAGGPGPREAALEAVLRRMFVIVAGLVLLDGIQTVLSGIIQGCGRQQCGALVNLVAFYVFGLPLALGLAFRLPLPPWLWGGGAELGLGWGPEGLYLGMAAGPVIQTICYSWILLQTDWERVSAAAVSEAALASCSSLASLIRRLDSGALAGVGLGGCSQRSSGTGLGGSLGPSSPWRLPAIEEAMREGRDSLDTSRPTNYNRSTSASASVKAAAAAPQSSWLDLNSSALAAAFTEVATAGGDGGGDGEGESAEATTGSGVRPGSFCANGRVEGGALAAAGGVAAPAGGAAAGHGGARLPRRLSGSRLRGGAAVAVEPHAGVSEGRSEAPAATPHPSVADTSVLEPVLEPTYSLELPADCADLAPGTAARSQALIMTHGSPPSATPGQHCLLAATLDPCSPASAAAAALLLPPSESAGSCLSPTLPPVLGSKPRGAQASAPVPVPPVADAPTRAAAAASRPAAAAVRWFRFGWGRAPVPIAQARAADAPGGVPADIAAAQAPLQLPGLSTPSEAAEALDASPRERRVAVEGSSPAAASPVPMAAALGRHRAAAGRGVGGGSTSAGAASGLLPSSGAVTRSAASSIGGGGGAGGGGGTSSSAGRGLACGEVYRSCESLATAVPGSGDFYAFSASAGTDGGSWLDPPPSLPQESPLQQARTRGARTSLEGDASAARAVGHELRGAAGSPLARAGLGSGGAGAETAGGGAP